MIPPFVIPKRSPFLISGASWELHDVLAATCFHHLGRHFPAPHVLPPQHPQLSASPLLAPTPPAGSPGRGCLLPTVSLQSFQPEGYRETLGTRLRAEIIANIELCLFKNINFTMFPFSRPKKYIYSQHLQHTTRSSSWKHVSSWHKNFPFLLNVIST